MKKFMALSLLVSNLALADLTRPAEIASLAYFSSEIGNFSKSGVNVVVRYNGDNVDIKSLGRLMYDLDAKLLYSDVWNQHRVITTSNRLSKSSCEIVLIIPTLKSPKDKELTIRLALDTDNIDTILGIATTEHASDPASQLKIISNLETFAGYCNEGMSGSLYELRVKQILSDAKRKANEQIEDQIRRN